MEAGKEEVTMVEDIETREIRVGIAYLFKGIPVNSESTEADVWQDEDLERI